MRARPRGHDRSASPGPLERGPARGALVYFAAMTAPETTASTRDNAAWIADLGAEGPRFDAAVADLRDYVFRAVLVYLTHRRAELAGLAHDELRQLAEDWSQRSVMQVLDNLGAFAGRSKFTTWAYRIAINAAAADLRRKRWSDVSLEGLDEGPGAPGSERVGRDRRALPETALERREIWRAVERIIAEDLSERQRAALTAVAIENVPVDVVADRLETNRNNVYKILHDARRRVRRELEARDWPPGDVLAAFEAHRDG